MSTRVMHTDEAFLRRGRTYTAGTGPTGVTTAQFIISTLTNPAASGRVVVVSRIVAYATAAGNISFRTNPTAGLPTTAVTTHNKVVGSAFTSVATVKIDGNVAANMSGGTATTGALPLLAQQVVYLENPFILLEGNSLGMTTTNTSGGNATTYVRFIWYEDNASTVELVK